MAEQMPARRPAPTAAAVDAARRALVAVRRGEAGRAAPPRVAKHGIAFDPAVAAAVAAAQESPRRVTDNPDVGGLL